LITHPVIEMLTIILILRANQNIIRLIDALFESNMLNLGCWM